MPTANEISYLLYVDDDAVPLEASMTLGNHLDNEIMVPGEDVEDFHLRVEVTPRGPVFVPLGQATLSINGVETDQAVRAAIGDTIGVGQSILQVGFELEQPQDEVDWFLVSDEGQEYSVIGEMAIGRAEGTDITLPDAHISRFHARLLERKGFVWIQDLGSANGTRVNGEKVSGGLRLFHGDVLNFDRFEFQLTARGGEITPLLKFDEPQRGTAEVFPPVATSGPSTQHHPTSRASLSGPSLVLGAASEAFPLAVGENIVGTHEGCSVRVQAPGMEERHLRIVVSVDGIRLTNIAAREKTLVNGVEVDSILLKHGDALDLGDVQMIFNSPPAEEPSNPSIPEFVKANPLIVLLGIVGIVTVLILLLLL